MARRKWRAGSAWSRGNVKQMWVPAEILKVRTADTPEKETYDVSSAGRRSRVFMWLLGISACLTLCISHNTILCNPNNGYFEKQICLMFNFRNSAISRTYFLTVYYANNCFAVLPPCQINAHRLHLPPNLRPFLNVKWAAVVFWRSDGEESPQGDLHAATSVYHRRRVGRTEMRPPHLRAAYQGCVFSSLHLRLRSALACCTDVESNDPTWEGPFYYGVL